MLLLHGPADNRSVFFLMRRALLRDGWRHIHTLNHSLLTRDIRAAAERLAVRVEEICRGTGHRRGDLVGHSPGGLTARHYVQCLGGDARVRTLVTLGTPHSGTLAALALLPHPLARQMRPRSPFLRQLAMPVPEGSRTRFSSFWSDLDTMMIPRETARLDHPGLRVRNIHARGVGHLTLPVDSGVSVRLRKELAGVARSAPGTAEAPRAWPERRVRAAEREHISNADRTPDQITARSPPKDGRLPVSWGPETCGRLSPSHTAGYSRRTAPPLLSRRKRSWW